MRIVTLGHKILQQPTALVEKIDKELAEQIKEMFTVLKTKKGVGLAAPQVGIPKRFFIVEMQEEKTSYVCINPEILSFQNSFEVIDEGCLSIPGVWAPVSRSKKVSMKYTDLDGKEHIVKVTGLLARAFQHECDHLEGKLFIDLLNEENLKKIMADLDMVRKKKK